MHLMSLSHCHIVIVTLRVCNICECRNTQARMHLMSLSHCYSHTACV